MTYLISVRCTGRLRRWKSLLSVKSKCMSSYIRSDTFNRFVKQSALYGSLLSPMEKFYTLIYVNQNISLNICYDKNMVIKGRTLYTVLTVFFSVVFCILKFLSLGWLTIFLSIPIIIYIVYYIVCGSTFANIKNKTRDDYKSFWRVSFFFLLSGLTFLDFGDYGPPVRIIPETIMPNAISVCACLFSACATVVLMITFMKRLRKRKNKLTKVHL